MTIVKANIPLSIGMGLDCDCGFLWPFVLDWRKVRRSGRFQHQRIYLLECQIAVPRLFLLIPDAVVTQVKLVDCKMQVRTIGYYFVEVGFIAAGVGQMSTVAAGSFLQVDADLEAAVQLAGPIAGRTLSKGQDHDNYC